MKNFFKSDIFYKRCDNRAINRKLIITAVIVAILFSLSACGKSPSSNKDGQNTSSMENTLESVSSTESLPSTESVPSTDTDVSPDEDTSEDKNAPISEDTADDDSWKAEFEKSLLDNYGVKPDHYEELGNGLYQVYVEIDGKVVRYVVVDSATGNYHG